jgi:predicted nucleic acid-binding protein
MAGYLLDSNAIICATAKALGLTLVTADKSLSKRLKGYIL